MEKAVEIQAGNNDSQNHSNRSVGEEDRRTDINKEELIGVRDPLAMEDEEKALLMLSTFLMGLIRSDD